MGDDTREFPERLGAMVDRIGNLRGGLLIPMGAEFHVTMLQGELQVLEAELRAVYVGLFGKDPWEDHPLA